MVPDFLTSHARTNPTSVQQSIPGKTLHSKQTPTLPREGNCFRMERLKEMEPKLFRYAYVHLELKNFQLLSVTYRVKLKCYKWPFLNSPYFLAASLLFSLPQSNSTPTVPRTITSNHIWLLAISLKFLLFPHFYRFISVVPSSLNPFPLLRHEYTFVFYLLIEA